MTVIGEITDHGKKLPATGQAWMDHQWGDFISVAGGGWDWFSAQLEDGSDVTISIVRNRENRTVLAYGTYVEPDGTAVHLSSDEFVVTSTAQWKSPHTDATYPARWNVRLPKRNLDLTLTPVVADQELDTRASTGVAYWEGAVEVVGDQSGRLMRGRGYVELTGYNAGAPPSR
ncbi:MAG: lipocalin family protein [Chloroflexia bacterium]